jgi:hypothetical protein
MNAIIQNTSEVFRIGRGGLPRIAWRVRSRDAISPGHQRTDSTSRIVPRAPRYVSPARHCSSPPDSNSFSCFNVALPSTTGHTQRAGRAANTGKVRPENAGHSRIRYGFAGGGAPITALLLEERRTLRLCRIIRLDRIQDPSKPPIPR